MKDVTGVDCVAIRDVDSAGVACSFQGTKKRLLLVPKMKLVIFWMVREFCGKSKKKARQVHA
ncbi:hypothetical protein [Candidatus Macondimonas diazotrophica]|uniref:Uncharacterized protein n=1 Tax=Candidatus Macondimonas diazotrophica TaxID=2305248 RepID=A0A4Z0F5S2_9GAMM|nr:hypothetical protein [Candidatus Macondimonas diazotrophica]NCU02135.1 hypothetical protein [Candidatus Macondimonas diazotrophica]TFZ81306.1 hypothetical protein E4680_13005 [Candidatus Macondimonas diazotrophica]